MSPRNPTSTIGNQIQKYDFGARGKQGNITEAEREFLQQRDGSGDDQRMLSVTHAKPDRLVHSNHGEVFTSAAVIKIDLAKMDQNKIYSQHLEESHQFKTSLENKEYKTTAEKELESYKYSAEKNRETLLVDVPKSAVVEVQIFGRDKLEKVSLSEAERRYNPEIERQEKQRLAEKREAEERSLREAKEKEKQSENDRHYKAVMDELTRIAQIQARKLKGDNAWISKVIDSSFLKEYEESENKKLIPSVVMLSTLQELIKYAKSKRKEEED